MNNHFWKCLAVLALACVISGCGSGPSLYKAGGKVTYKNAPVEGADVLFAYDDGNFANGRTDKEGKFMVLFGGKPGAALGKGKITVTKKESITMAAPAGGTAPAGQIKNEADWKAEQKRKNDEMAAFKKAQDKMNEKGGPQDLIPAKYASSATSGFTFEIKTSEKDNDFPLDLKD